MLNWHTLEIKEVLSSLGSDLRGLTQQEAKTRLEKYGPNELMENEKISPLKIFLDQFKNFLIIILLAATIVSAFIGEWLDAIVIFAIVIACAILGLYQEFKAEKAVEALKKIAALTARVIRRGEEVEIPARDIVPGDIVVLRTGDKVPADCRLIEEMNLKVDEAPLTGESKPVKKSILPLEKDDVAVADRKNMLYTATVVTYGHGKGAVTSTGMNSEFGKIATMIQEVEEEETPLKKRLDVIGKWLGIFSLIICAVAGTIGIIKGHGVIEMFIWGVSLAVAAVPEALPAVVTGALSIGVSKMAKKNAIVRKLPAVETLGCTTVICSDKTGTLTKNEMTVRRIYTNDKMFDVTGVGFQPEGEYLIDGNQVNPKEDPNLTLLLKISTLCNDVYLHQTNTRWSIIGDPTEGALLVSAIKAGIKVEALKKEMPRIGEVPFESERKRMSTIHSINGIKVAYIKGAPEIILDLSTHLLKNGKIVLLTEEERGNILKVNEQMASNALRILGFAYRHLPEDLSEYSSETVEKELVFVGLQGMIDPPRDEVIEAMRHCKEAGIKAVMITGDHKLTAIAVAKELGQLPEEGDQTRVLTGIELDRMNAQQLEDVIEEVVVYARVSPKHKLRIVDAFKKKGEVVAMTGDGINDAPALKRADIGVSMGITGTDVTKEASAMVLADDNFASIVAAVEEGRAIYDNIKKYLVYLISCNIAEILILGGSFFIGLPLPLVAIQILWVNLTTDGLPALALGVDPPDPDIMRRPPRDPQESVFSRRIIALMTVMALNITFVIVPLFFWYLKSGGYYEQGVSEAMKEGILLKGQTIVLAMMVLFELINAYNNRSDQHSLFKVGFLKNKWLNWSVLSSVVLAVIVIQVPALDQVFHTSYLNMKDWVIVIIATLTIFPVVEITKWILNRMDKAALMTRH
jgi:Ca2+-transporting ATPase